MWTVIYITQNKNALDRLRAELEKSRIIIKVRELSRGGDSPVYEVLVPESEIAQAHEVLLNLQLER